MQLYLYKIKNKILVANSYFKNSQQYYEETERNWKNSYFFISRVSLLAFSKPNTEFILLKYLIYY